MTNKACVYIPGKQHYAAADSNYCKCYHHVFKLIQDQSLYGFQIMICKHGKWMHSNMDILQYMVCCHCYIPTISSLINCRLSFQTQYKDGELLTWPEDTNLSSFRIHTQVCNLWNGMGNELVNFKVSESFLCLRGLCNLGMLLFFHSSLIHEGLCYMRHISLIALESWRLFLYHAWLSSPSL